MKKLLPILIVTIFIVGQAWITVPVLAVLSSCSASVSNSSISANSSGTLSFTLNNTSAQTIAWLKIIAPDGFTIISVSSSGWSGSVDSSAVATFTGSLAAGESKLFNVNVNSGDAAGSQEWIIRASDASTGDSPTGCSGSLGVTITTESVDNTAPVVSDITISDIDSSSAKITWTTNEDSTSVVEYGASTSYGTNNENSTSTTTHTINLTGLSANTAYHYKVKSTDGSGNTGESGDNILTTAKASSSSSTSSSTSSSSSASSSTDSSPAPSSVTVSSPILDRTAPKVSIEGDFSKPFKQAPTIKGKVSDNQGVSRIEYSTDNGQNWLPTTVIPAKAGIYSASFEFTPNISEDGNYKIRVRVKDLNGNLGYSKVVVLVIDRLLPEVGGSLFSFGPQILEPLDSGEILILQGLEEKITLSAVGGPTQVDIISQGEGVFSLVKNSDSGLWSGTLSFEKPGIYNLVARSIDGAGNKTLRQLSPVRVLARGVVKEGMVSVFVFDLVTQRFVLWDGESFGQQNPQQVVNQSYGLILPAGKYYLQVSSPSYKTIKSQIFTLNRSHIINSNFSLEEAKGWSFGPIKFNWPSFSQKLVEINLEQESLDIQPQNLVLVGKLMPDIPFGDLSFRGQPTVITFLNSWAPNSSDQLNNLEKLANRADIKSLVVVPQESTSGVAIYQKRGNYQLTMVADPDGLLIKPFNIQFLPTHIFVNRTGLVRKVEVGVLSADEITTNLLD
jgi:hypothetical protein